MTLLLDCSLLIKIMESGLDILTEMALSVWTSKVAHTKVNQLTENINIIDININIIDIIILYD